MSTEKAQQEILQQLSDATSNAEVELAEQKLKALSLARPQTVKKK